MLWPLAASSSQAHHKCARLSRALEQPKRLLLRISTNNCRNLGGRASKTRQISICHYS